MNSPHSRPDPKDSLNPWAGGDPISDDADNNPGYSDLHAGAAGHLPSVYLTSDGDNVFFRMRVRSDPTSRNGGSNSTSWLVSIAVDGVQASAVGPQRQTVCNRLLVYASSADGSTVREIYTTPFTNDGNGTSFGARAIEAPDKGWFVHIQVPIAQMMAVAPTVTGSTPIQLFYGTSQAANLSVMTPRRTRDW